MVLGAGPGFPKQGGGQNAKESITTEWGVNYMIALIHYFNYIMRLGLLDNAKLIGLLIEHIHLPTKMNLSIPPSWWEIYFLLLSPSNCSGGRCLWAGLKVIIFL